MSDLVRTVRFDRVDRVDRPLRSTTRARRSRRAGRASCAGGLAAASLVLGLPACQTGDTNDAAMVDRPTATADDAAVPVPPTDARTNLVMLEKLRLSHRIVDSIVLDEFTAVAADAASLAGLSNESDWFVHDTAWYTTISADFRDITMALAEAAEAEDAAAVADGFAALVESCLECHRALRERGLYREMPGRISQGTNPSWPMGAPRATPAHAHTTTKSAAESTAETTAEPAAEPATPWWSTATDLRLDPAPRKTTSS